MFSNDRNVYDSDGNIVCRPVQPLGPDRDRVYRGHVPRPAQRTLPGIGPALFGPQPAFSLPSDRSG